MGTPSEHAHFNRSAVALIRESLDATPHTLTANENTATLDFALALTLNWKGQPLTRNRLDQILGSTEGTLTIPLPLSAKKLKTLTESLAQFSGRLIEENLDRLEFWGRATQANPSGFSEGIPSLARDQLAQLYRDQFVAPEKKEFIIDLARSSGPYLVSANDPSVSFLDGAAQIASLALGFNHPDFNAMDLRPELQDPEFRLERWDIRAAYAHLLTRLSGLPHATFVHSGAEAIETCLRACQIKHRDRRHLIAFDGSFHGRTWLALHATHSPAKRTPFESFADKVTFVSFPETKTPDDSPKDPAHWLEVWSAAGAPDFLERLSHLQNHRHNHSPNSGNNDSKSDTDTLLKTEIASLLAVRDACLAHPTLGVLIEPMQCEGGDRYGTGRFFRALRALTAGLDVPLIFDEVQTGFGLGGPFFWHQLFHLPTPPDAIALAKKAQVGVCLSQIDPEITEETSPASLYRGYIQARAMEGHLSESTHRQIAVYLKALQEHVGHEIVSSPRGRALAFSFDLPTPEILNKLVARRFHRGILFYPAGDRTARFRALIGQSKRELFQLFTRLVLCFEDLAAAGLMPALPPHAKWLDRFPDDRAVTDEPPLITRALPWDARHTPHSKEAYLALHSSGWTKLFNQLLAVAPSLVLRSLPLEELEHHTAEDLWNKYTSDPDWTLLRLLWESARRFGHTIERIRSLDALNSIATPIEDLQRLVYEPERQTPLSAFRSAVTDAHGVVLVHRRDGRLLGLCAAGTLSQFASVPMVDRDPLLKDTRAVYSTDLTVHPDFRATGLGKRLKVEQIIAARGAGASCLRSRNRIPQADAMVKLNASLSAVVIDRNDKDYGGTGTSIYQSISFYQPHIESSRAKASAPARSLGRSGALKNKTSLANFVSPAYLAHMELLREILPPPLRHVALASSRAEAIDKAIKCFRLKRPLAKTALSFKGDYFGSTSAVARSLGESELKYFDFPSIDVTLSALEQEIARRGPETILGLFVTPTAKSDPLLKGFLAICRGAKIPVWFEETRSAFFEYERSSFFCAREGLMPDGLSFFGGGQAAVVAMNTEYFVPQPLMLISTWDGDEHSLYHLRERILQAYENH